MNVAIHQPQYLPWIPYFLKIKACDVFIFLDTVDFQKNGLQNRNKIKTSQGGNWLTVPVQHKSGQKICDTLVDNSHSWQKKHWQTISQCYSKANSFHEHKDELERFYAKKWCKLSQLNIELSLMMMRWFDIKTPTIKSSEMNAAGSASELVLNLCLEAKATEYLSGTGAENYLRVEDFKKYGISINYQPPILPESYPQLFLKAGFLNNISALDIILNCGSSWKNHMPKL